MIRDDDTPTLISSEPIDLPPTIADDRSTGQAARTMRQPDRVFRDLERGVGYDTETTVMEGPPPSLAWLVVLSGPWTGRIFALRPEGTTLGRRSACEIILDDDAVSRFHATLRIEEDEKGTERFFIQDLATENGTFVNGQKIDKQFLTDKDEIKIGETELGFLKWLS